MFSVSMGSRTCNLPFLEDFMINISCLRCTITQSLSRLSIGGVHTGLYLRGHSGQSGSNNEITSCDKNSS